MFDDCSTWYGCMLLYLWDGLHAPEGFKATGISDGHPSPHCRLQAAERAKAQAQNSSVTSPEAVAETWLFFFVCRGLGEITCTFCYCLCVLMWNLPHVGMNRSQVYPKIYMPKVNEKAMEKKWVHLSLMNQKLYILYKWRLLYLLYI